MQTDNRYKYTCILLLLLWWHPCLDHLLIGHSSPFVAAASLMHKSDPNPSADILYYHCFHAARIRGTVLIEYADFILFLLALTNASVGATGNITQKNNEPYYSEKTWPVIKKNSERFLLKIIVTDTSKKKHNFLSNWNYCSFRKKKTLAKTF